MNLDDPLTCHATAVLVGEAGLLLRGRSGAGKTSTALALLALARREPFARLVGDDRIRLTGAAGRVIARPHPVLAGWVEVRGMGIIPIDHEPACVVRLVAELIHESEPWPARLPGGPPTTRICDVDLPLLRVPAPDGPTANASRVMAVLCAMRDQRDAPALDISASQTAERL